MSIAQATDLIQSIAILVLAVTAIITTATIRNMRKR